MSRKYGITREEEEQKLKEIISIAEIKLSETRRSAQNLADELHEMLEIFDESDKEAMTLWNNTNSMFRQVSQSLQRAERARKKPYFGRIDFQDKKLGKDEVYYIGRSAIAENPSQPDVIDWRAPVSSVYYESGLGDTSYFVRGEGQYDISLSRKRTYEIEDDRLKAFYDSDVVANDELLTKYLAKNKNAVLGNIIATIQQEQNEVIRKKPQHNVLIQGAAGSGKTTVAMHRISYILYNYELEFPPEDFYIIGSNQMLLNYITGVLPELDVYGVAQMTMEQLFVRLLYEDWDSSYTIHPVKKGVTPPVKGTKEWFDSLEEFCDRYEKSVIPQEDVCIEKNGALLLSKEAIAQIMENSRNLSRADKITRLTEHLTAKLENEICGKYYSYSEDEKKTLTRKAQFYFGRREWKGSIFELYDNFVIEQNEKGHKVELPGTDFDVYDLAALAYLYKRIKEDEIIREAGHVIIDEAQDFGMMVYCSLKRCLSKCTYTIMGDVSQNISLDYGLNDWSELRSLMLPERGDYFGLLRKSYRNTVEISHFATEILYHGNFQLYPVEPIIRHGEAVCTIGCEDRERLLEKAAQEIQRWLDVGRETIAVICADENEARSVHEGLQGKVSLLSYNREEMEFKNGVMVLSLENTKGLEFDAVLIFDASEEKFPAEDGQVKRLYVAATRALHELTVLYQGKLTKLISEPVPEEKRRKVVEAIEITAAPRKKEPVLPEKTNEEIFREKALEGEYERSLRDVYGPRKIVVQSKAGIDGKNTARSGATKPGTSANKLNKPSGANVPSRANTAGVETAGVNISGLKQVSMNMPGVSRTGTNVSGTNTSAVKRPGANIPGTKPYGTTLTRSTATFRSSTFLGEFGTIPDSRTLRPPAHPPIDCSIRSVEKGKGGFDLFSSYGTLHVSPLSDEVIRICFAKGKTDKFPQRMPEFASTGFRYRKRENPSAVEFLTEKLVVHIEKKTGAVSFLTSDGKLLMTENPQRPRLIRDEKAWMFFDWERAEKMKARGVGDQFPERMDMNFARYISFGRESMRSPGVMSPKGYEILLPPGVKLLCCRVPSYGPYLCVEGSEVIDYYFRVR